jgi:hypothetical protein
MTNDRNDPRRYGSFAARNHRPHAVGRTHGAPTTSWFFGMLAALALISASFWAMGERYNPSHLSGWHAPPENTGAQPRE